MPGNRSYRDYLIAAYGGKEGAKKALMISRSLFGTGQGDFEKNRRKNAIRLPSKYDNSFLFRKNKKESID